ncbi:hypothetical protein H5085_02465 [Pseudoalteromonas sp. SR43-6]|uniref:hypothetical protein n=1 Tax=unclassified Pseudoalteromonas TaxID=194690 RepID=UPI0015FB2D4B|nr:MULTISPECIES: hypothetical protein [unclassified Pseudoalteromonas]MBB1287665.1 hypothetical protein [Pseudoalteromonas sp. SR41-5]MBB1373205.1 hypothetical protein [Pseudoalteromonas sp. SR43-6]MBB1412306.1 hypothetical protein [Pseudoalteromonas sp. SG43-8]
MVDSENKGSSYWKLASFLLIGILIPLTAALTPWLLEQISPKNNLSFKYVEPISTDTSLALSVTILNAGSDTQKNIEVWLPFSVLSITRTEVGDDGKLNVFIPKPVIELETSIPYSSAELIDSNYLLKFESLRPNESISIKVISTGTKVFSNRYELESMRIVSQDVIATVDQPTDTQYQLYRTGSIILVVLIFLFLSWAIYYEYLMPNEQKEKYLLKQIDELTSKR